MSAVTRARRSVIHEVVDLFDGIQAEAIGSRVFHPGDRVIYGELSGGGDGEVEAREVPRKPTPLPALAIPGTRRGAAVATLAIVKGLGPEPVVMLGVDGRLLVDMVHGVIEDDLDVGGVGGVDNRLQVIHRTKAWLHVIEVQGPVAVVGRVGTAVAPGDGHIGVLHGNREPKDIDAELGEIALLNLLKHTVVVASLVVRRQGRAGNGLKGARGVALEEAIDKHEVEHRVPPVEAAEEGGRAGVIVAGRAGDDGVEGARAVGKLEGVVGIRDPVDGPVGGRDQEFVLHLRIPGYGHVRRPQGVVPGQGHAVGPAIGREGAANLNGRLRTHRVGKEMITELETIVALG